MRNFLIIVLLLNACFTFAKRMPDKVSVGAEQTYAYFPDLKGKRIGLVVNQTSLIGKTHLVDSLLKKKFNVVKIFAPEHGFRGTADAGTTIKDGKDKKTGLAVVSLYGKKEKPSAEDLKGIDLLVFDIQDVGCRFYTFLSTLHYVMEAAAENNIPLIVLDRPNPNGYYVDGPVLDMKLKSFVGVAPIPVVHGVTLGEYAQMATGENWYAHAKDLHLQVVSCKYYYHLKRVELPVKPSPNLPNARAVELYPSLCFFEGTTVSVGRGTSYPFQLIGSPTSKINNAFVFIPKANTISSTPFLMGQKCFGYDLRKSDDLFLQDYAGLNLKYILTMYKACKDKNNFFLSNLFFDKLMGNDKVRKMIIDGKTEDDIRASWATELANYKEIRKKYLLYPDFE